MEETVVDESEEEVAPIKDSYPYYGDGSGRSEPMTIRSIRIRDASDIDSDTTSSSLGQKELKMKGLFSQPQGTMEYSVKSTDKLETIALTFDSTTSQLMRLNHLASSMIFPGQKLYVPDPNSVEPIVLSPTNKNFSDKPVTFSTTSSRVDVPTISMTPKKAPDANKPPVKPAISGNSKKSRLFMRSRSKDEEGAVPGERNKKFRKGRVKKQNSTPIPGRVIRQAAPQESDTDENSKQFLKLKVKYITDGEGVVSGTMLVTPNAIMFDPNVSDPLVIERGVRSYGVITQMDTVLGASMYHDVSAMSLRAQSGESTASACPVYIPGKTTLHSSDSKSSETSETSNSVSSPEKTVQGGDDDEDGDRRRGARSDEEREGDTGKNEVDGDSDKCRGEKEGSSEQLSNGTETVRDVDLGERDRPPPNRDPTNNSIASSDGREVERPSPPSDAQVRGSSTGEVDVSESGGDSCPASPETTFPNDVEMMDRGDVQCGSGKGSSGIGLRESDDRFGESVKSPLDDDERPNRSSCDSNIVDDADHRLTDVRNASCRNGAHDDQIEDPNRPTARGGDPSEPPTDLAKESEGSEEQTLNVRPTAREGRDTEPSEGIAPSSTRTGPASPPARGAVSGMETDENRAFVDFSSGLFVTDRRKCSMVADMSECVKDDSFTERALQEIEEGGRLLKRLSEEELIREKSWETDEIADGMPSSPSRERSVPSDETKSNRVEKKEVNSLQKSIQIDYATKDFEELRPRRAQRYEHPPLYLCLKVYHPMQRTFEKREESEGDQTSNSVRTKKSEKLPEYWFAIPREKADGLYSFFLQWSPEKYGKEVNLDDFGFVPVEQDQRMVEMVEDFFSEPISKDWEIVSKEEANRRRMTLLECEKNLPLPQLLGESKLLQTAHIVKLLKELPPRTEGYDWTLIYNTASDGFSLRSLYRTMQDWECPVLLLLEDSSSILFGALVSCPLKESESYYGTGESFLFHFETEDELDLVCYKWTGENMYFIKGDKDSISIGGGGGTIGLWLDGDLYHGRCRACKTFNNKILSGTEDFVIKNLEVWGFVM